jgi:hypothetical protein
MQPDQDDILNQPVRNGQRRRDVRRGASGNEAQRAAM